MPGKKITTEYLIIGNSAGGIGAAEAIREVDRSGALTIVSDEPCSAYSRPLISEYLAGERTFEEMLFRPAEFYTDNNIDLWLGSKVQKLILDRHIAKLDNGDQITWKKLLLATGGIPIVPKIVGADKKGVFTFLTLEDAKAIADYIENAAHAVVIGGGLIGISVTEALTKLGVAVTVVEMKDRVLNTILDEQASQIAEDTLTQANIRIITNDTVSEIIGGSSAYGVLLNSGANIPCDLVIIAIGVLPRTELALNTGIQVNRGIIVDRCMSTSCADVYCCGDAAEAYDFIYDDNRVIPIWPNAYIGGRIAGYNMAGMKTEYQGGTAMNSLNYFGLDIATAGIVTPQEPNNLEVITRQANGSYRKVVIDNGLINGMIFIKDIDKSGMVFGLMRNKVNVTDFKQELLSDSFGLVCMPAEIRHERLGSPPPEAVSLSGILEEAEEMVSDE
jgi:NAD(P)H-nitrite reductase large subunit